jgi:hypothetical protein
MALWCHWTIRCVLVNVPSFSVGGGREEEHLGLELLGAHLAGLDLRAVLPPGRGLDQREVPDDHPLQLGHSQPLHPGVRRPHRRVLPEQEVALDGPGDLRHDRVVGAVIACQARQIVEAEVVALGGRRSPPGLQQADRVVAHVAPEPLARRVAIDERVERLVGVVRAPQLAHHRPPRRTGQLSHRCPPARSPRGA